MKINVIKIIKVNLPYEKETTEGKYVTCDMYKLKGEEVSCFKEGICIYKSEYNYIDLCFSKGIVILRGTDTEIINVIKRTNSNKEIIRENCLYVDRNKEYIIEDIIEEK